MDFKTTNYSDVDPYDVDSLQFAIEERIGKPQFFVGREAEFRTLLKWVDNIPEKYWVANSSGLTAQVSKDALTHDFDLEP